MRAEGDMGADLATVREGDVDLVWTNAQGLPVRDFEDGPALAVLLAREVVFPNCQHWRGDLPEPDRRTAVLLVNCSDVFAWACADAEILPYGEIERLYRMWRLDPAYGSAAWSIHRRGIPPQAPVADLMAKAGVWDVAKLAGGEGAAGYIDQVLAEAASREQLA